MTETTTTNDRRTVPTAGLPRNTAGGAHFEYLVKINGQFYVASRIMGYTDPVERINYYRIIAAGSDAYTYMPDLDALIFVPLTSTGHGHYIATDGRGKAHLRIDYHASCDWIDDYPVPCPKVRKGIETRWNGTQGYWEKRLQKGWVPA